MDPETEAANPFESPAAPIDLDQRHWWALWGATGLLAVLALVSIGIDALTPLTLLIPLVGVPGLVRTIFDLGRKQSAGWIIDAGVQLKSFGASLFLTGVALLSGGIAGGASCFAGVAAADTLHYGYGGALVLMLVSVLVSVAAVIGVFYLLGPRRVDQLKRHKLSQPAQSLTQSDADERNL